ncbi:ABC transporter substrate-binding protein [Thermincola ferriacetica]|uniref:ABC transporter substrate-binding protein n=1 Tax=Thermincola ferriacetica TaxID=281456 RepID=A0A0L6W710_9FIRM|nr:ABC transporter substrate-binding protein [Thermincola ferriacetica]KNZ71168.1 ABC transporter substrate-binding protein [Thermincola ferriacetica]
MRKKAIASVLVLCMFIIAGCSTARNRDAGIGGNAKIPPKIRISLQYGIGYAPLQIMKEKKLLEKYLPGVKVEWKQMGTGGVIREALVKGDLDVGFMGIPPYLVAWDKGVDWKIAVALASSPQGLQTNKKTVNSLKDLGKNDKIAVPIPGSVQHILLAMAAEKELGDAKALDKNLISMTHPDGATALISEAAISAHFTSPPYLFKELKAKNIKQIVDAEKAFGGEHSFLVGVTTKKFHDEYPLAYAAFCAAVNDAIYFVNNNTREAAKILAPEYKLSEEETYKYLTWPGTNYTSTPYGLMGFAQFMQKYGYIRKVPKDLNEIAWENVVSAIGKKAGNKSVLEKAQYR